MRLRKKVLWGKINNNGVLEISDEELYSFTQLHKGKRVKIVLDIMPQALSPRLVNYYYGYVIPSLTRAFYDKGNRMTESECEEFLRSISPVCLVESWEEGKHKQIIKAVDGLDNAELMEHIEFLKQYGAENLETFIDDPETI